MLNYNIDLINLIKSWIIDYVNKNMVDFYKKSFHDKMVNELKAIFDGESFYDKDKKYFTRHIKKAVKSYYKEHMPYRSYINNKVSHNPSIDKIRLKIDLIRNKPQPEQRTEAWYRFRYDLITASNASKCLGSQSQKNNIICEKCADFTMKSDTQVNHESPMHWGVKYEPLSVLYYEYTYNLKVEDFGCIQHDKYKFLGASPDGIVVDPSSNMYGRMLEIKNPKSRYIDGIPKDEYWVQMQLQMEVCDLNYCDFLETKFIEYDNAVEYYDDGTFNKASDGSYKGIILHFMKNGKSHYFYPRFDISQSEYDKWEDEIIMSKELEGYEWVAYVYWKLEKVSCVLVLRNKRWFEKAILEIEKIWDIVERERIDKSWHTRVAKKQVKKPSIPKPPPSQIFHIDI